MIVRCIPCQPMLYPLRQLAPTPSHYSGLHVIHLVVCYYVVRSYFYIQCARVVLCLLCTSMSTHPCWKSEVLAPTPSFAFAAGGAPSCQEVGVIDNPFFNYLIDCLGECIHCLPFLHMASGKPAPGAPQHFANTLFQQMKGFPVGRQY
jgi:hypothetical protein